MRINLTKKDIVNLIYMQLGFSKQISESLIDEFFSLIISNIKKEKIKTFKIWNILDSKKSRIGETPKLKKKKLFLKEKLFYLNHQKSLKNL